MTPRTLLMGGRGGAIFLAVMALLAVVVPLLNLGVSPTRRCTCPTIG